MGLFAVTEIFLAIGLGSYQDSDSIRESCEHLLNSGKCSEYHIKTIVDPIRHATDPLSMYRAGLRLIRVDAKYYPESMVA